MHEWCTSATGIRQCVDRGFIVREKWRASPRQHDDFHVYECGDTVEGGMVKFYCDEVFGCWAGCVPRAVYSSRGET